MVILQHRASSVERTSSAAQDIHCCNKHGGATLLCMLPWCAPPVIMSQLTCHEPASVCAVSWILEGRPKRDMNTFCHSFSLP